MVENLTPGQQRAVQSRRHVAVTANAGSGKTRVLVERYVDILLGGEAAMADIVVLTFTEKAAGELRRRVAETVSGSLASATDPHRIAQLESIRGSLSSAIIGTIHAFAARLLREYPVEAGVDPSFSIIQGIDREHLLRETLRETLRGIFAAEDRLDVRRALAGILRLRGRVWLLRTLKILVERRDRLMRLTGPDGLYREPDDAILAVWDARVHELVDAALTDPALLADMDSLTRIATGKRVTEVRDDVARFGAAASLADRAMLFSAIAQRMFTQGGRPAAAFMGRTKEPREAIRTAARIARRRQALAPLLLALNDPAAPDRNRTMLEMTRTLVAVAQEAAERYEARKLETGQLDFEDLLIRTRLLLDDEAMRLRLSRRFKYIMVDEYQDTDRLQYEIILPILDRLVTGNLFIVGDPKQTIYGFRNADVTVFERTRAEIAGTSGPESAIVLEESFRPLRDLVAFVNLLFSGLLDADVRAPTYDPLVRARQNADPGRTELLLADGEGQIESDLLAARIAALIAAEHVVYGRDEQPRSVRYGDVAILLRSRAPLPDIETALARMSIPYVVSGGTGFFQTQEVLDVYNYLRFLLNPGDDAALAGILRSPFFLASDVELFLSAFKRGQMSLWQSLISIESPPPALRRAARVLRDHIDIALRLPVPELLARIFDGTSIGGKLVATPPGRQALANIEKLQRIARSFERQGLSGLREFVSRLGALVDEAEDEGQAATENPGDSVQIMTVHAAKGLEFPVVVLPRLHRTFPLDTEPYVDEALGIGLSAREGDELPPATALLREMARRKTLAEEKRVLYVACTRARDMLILSGEPARMRNADNALRWVLDTLAIDPATEQPAIEYPVSTTFVPAAGNTAPAPEQHSLVIHVVRNVDRARHIAGSVEDSTLPRILVNGLPPTVHPEIFSASMISVCRECPYKFYLRYVLGFPDDRGIVSPEGADPASVGSAFHEVMRRIPLVGQAVPDIVASELFPGVDGASDAASRVAAMVNSAITSTFWQEEVRSGMETRTELSLAAPIAGNFLTGTIDRLYRAPSGVWTIVDYKTEPAVSDTLTPRSLAHASQMEVYAVLLSKQMDVDRIETCLFYPLLPEHPYRHSYDRQDLERLEKEIAETIDGITGGRFHHRQVPCPVCGTLPWFEKQNSSAL